MLLPFPQGWGQHRLPRAGRLAAPTPTKERVMSARSRRLASAARIAATLLLAIPAQAAIPARPAVAIGDVLPATYAPCSTITWSYDATAQPRYAVRMPTDIRAALLMLAGRTGIQFQEAPTWIPADLVFDWSPLADYPPGGPPSPSPSGPRWVATPGPGSTSAPNAARNCAPSHVLDSHQGTSPTSPPCTQRTTAPPFPLSCCPLIARRSVRF